MKWQLSATFSCFSILNFDASFLKITVLLRSDKVHPHRPYSRVHRTMGLWVSKTSRFAWHQALTNGKPDVLHFLSDSKTQSLAFGFRHPAGRQAAERLAEVIRVCGMHSMGGLSMAMSTRNLKSPSFNYIHISTRSGSISHKYFTNKSCRSKERKTSPLRFSHLYPRHPKIGGRTNFTLYSGNIINTPNTLAVHILPCCCQMRLGLSLLRNTTN